MRYVALCLLAVLACHNPVAVGAGREFTIALGQRVRLAEANLTIGFDTVTSDSRCPINMECIAAGNAEVVLALHPGPIAVEPPDRIVTLNTGLEPRAIPVDGYRLQLIRLDPQPIAGEPLPEPYRVTLLLAPLAP